MSSATFRPARPVNRRILSLWFPRLAAERVLRLEPALADSPLAVVGELGNLRQITSLTHAASAAAVSRGQALAEALTLCPDLITRPHDPAREAQGLAALRRWAGRFSPWVAEEGTESLMIDLTGCAHLFGGEAALFAQVHDDCADLGLSVRAAIADTAGRGMGAGALRGRRRPLRSPAAATPSTKKRGRHASRAEKRHWVRGGPAPEARQAAGGIGRISPPVACANRSAPCPSPRCASRPIPLRALPGWGCAASVI